MAKFRVTLANWTDSKGAEHEKDDIVDIPAAVGSYYSFEPTFSGEVTPSVTPAAKQPLKGASDNAPDVDEDGKGKKPAKSATKKPAK